MYDLTPNCNWAFLLEDVNLLSWHFLGDVYAYTMYVCVREREMREGRINDATDPPVLPERRGKAA